MYYILSFSINTSGDSVIMSEQSISFTSKRKISWEDGFNLEDMHMKAMAYKYTSNFLDSVDYNTVLAGEVCRFFEPDSHYFDGITGHITKEKEDYKQNSKKFEKKKELLEAQKEKVEDEIDNLKMSVDEISAANMLFGKKRAVREAQAKLNAAENELEKIEKGLEKKSPTLKLVYIGKDNQTVARKEDWEALSKVIYERFEKYSRESERGNIHSNLLKFVKELRFNEKDVKLMEFFLCYQYSQDLTEFVNIICSGNKDNYCHMVSRMTGVDKAYIEKAMKLDSAIMSSGIVADPEVINGGGRKVKDYREDDYDDDEDDKDHGDPYYDNYKWPVIAKDIADLMNEDRVSFDDLISLVVGSVAKTDLAWSKDFTYLGKSGAQISDLLKGSIASKSKGTNIMFFGAPGLGKTEGAKALCKELGINLYVVGKKNDEGDEPSRAERMRQISLAQRILEQSGNAAILVDEAEDVLDFYRAEKDKKGYSKAYINDLVENNAVPIIWTANDVNGIHPATLSRIRGVEFKVPPAATRLNIFKGLCEKNKLEMSEEAMQSIAYGFAPPIRLLQSGIDEVKKIEAASDKPLDDNEKLAKLSTSIRAIANLAFGNSKAIEVTETLAYNYDVSLMNAEHANQPIGELISDIKDSGIIDFRVLMTGKPGTGKSETARFIASELGMEVMFKRASDILDKYVGGTEGNIADAFQEAEDMNKVLVIDEIGSILQDRRKAEKSWEKTQVNEFLTDLEKAKIPVILTDNFKEDLDIATIRRVDFKIECKYLTAEQSRKAYVKYFGGEAPASFDSIKDIGVGDFANVKRQMRFAKDKSAESIVKRLEAEIKARNDKEKEGNPIGFRAPPEKTNDNSKPATAAKIGF